MLINCGPCCVIKQNTVGGAFRHCPASFACNGVAKKNLHCSHCFFIVVSPPKIARRKYALVYSKSKRERAERYSRPQFQASASRIVDQLLCASSAAHAKNGANRPNRATNTQRRMDHPCPLLAVRFRSLRVCRLLSYFSSRR